MKSEIYLFGVYQQKLIIVSRIATQNLGALQLICIEIIITKEMETEKSTFAGI